MNCSRHNLYISLFVSAHLGKCSIKNTLISGISADTTIRKLYLCLPIKANIRPKAPYFLNFRQTQPSRSAFVSAQIRLITVYGLNSYSHKSSLRRKTGPSLQTLFGPEAVCIEQPIQAPNPQPMRSSKLNSPSPGHARYTAFSIGIGPQA